MEMKICVKCEQNKPISQFQKHVTSKDGHRSYCKTCSRLAYKNSTKDRKDKYLAKTLVLGTIEHRHHTLAVTRLEKLKTSPFWKDFGIHKADVEYDCVRLFLSEGIVYVFPSFVLTEGIKQDTKKLKDYLLA